MEYIYRIFEGTFESCLEKWKNTPFLQKHFPHGNQPTGIGLNAIKTNEV